METILFEIIDEQTSLLAYETYVRSSIKKDVVKQRNRIVNRVVRAMCREIVTEIEEEIDERDQPRAIQAQTRVGAEKSPGALEEQVLREQS